MIKISLIIVTVIMVTNNDNNNDTYHLAEERVDWMLGKDNREARHRAPPQMLLL